MLLGYAMPFGDCGLFGDGRSEPSNVVECEAEDRYGQFYICSKASEPLFGTRTNDRRYVREPCEWLGLDARTDHETITVDRYRNDLRSVGRESRT